MRILLPVLLFAVFCAPLLAEDIAWVTVSTVEDVIALKDDCDSVIVSDGDSVEVLAKLAELKPALKRLSVTNLGTSPAGLEHLKSFTKLEHLAVEGGILTQHRDAVLNAITAASSVSYLDLNLW